MEQPTKLAVLIALILPVTSGPTWSANAPSATPPAASTNVVAHVGNVDLTEAEMEKELGMSIYNAENQLYQVKKSWIDKKAKDVLFDQAAKEAKLSRKDWEQRNIESQIPASTQQEVDQVAQRMTPPNQPADPAKAAQVQQQASQYLVGQKRQQRETTLYTELTAKYPVDVRLVKPVAPHIDVAYSPNDPVKGPKDAPVTIIEFTDFQCPWCQRSQESLHQVEQTYGEKVKVVARAFPLPMHPRAMPAASAAFCAKEQGKYWEYREKLFAKQELSDDDFKRYAKELGLKEKKFNDCVSAKKYDSWIQADMSDGQRYGVQGTPTFFVNGIQTGFPQLADTVKDELAKKKS